jgi:RNA polymerase sigma-70 factor (ECF subfamily)
VAPISNVIPNEEAALVVAARSGDRAAFELLIAPYHLPLLRYLTRQTGDPELARDLVQDTLLRAYDRLDQLDRDRSFAAWLYTIAHSRLKMEYRRRGLRRWVSLDWLTQREAEKMPAFRVEGPSEQSIERDMVQQVLQELGPAQSQALLLHSIAGLTASEVAEILGISRSAAERRISRAKVDFRRRYLALEGGPGDVRV